MRVDGMRDGLWKRTLKIFYGMGGRCDFEVWNWTLLTSR